MPGCIRNDAVEEDAAVGRDRVVAVEQVLQRRDAGAVGVDRLGRLGELLRVAEQHHRAGRPEHGDRVGQRELARLVDDEHVDGAAQVGAGPQPGRSRRPACADRDPARVTDLRRWSRRGPRRRTVRQSWRRRTSAAPADPQPRAGG